MIKIIKGLSLRSLLIILLGASAFIPLLLFFIINLNMLSQSSLEESRSKANVAKEKLKEGFIDYQKYMSQQLENLKEKRSFVFSIQSQEKNLFEKEAKSYLENTSIHRLLIYDEFGSFLFWSVKKEDEIFSPKLESQIRLNQSLTEKILTNQSHTVVEARNKGYIEIIHYSLIKQGKNPLAIVEQVVEIPSKDVAQIVADPEIKLSILGSQGQIQYSMLKNLIGYPKEYFETKKDGIYVMDYGNKIYQNYKWQMDSFVDGSLLLSIDQTKYQERKTNLYQSFFIVLGLLGILFLPVLYFATNFIVRPIRNLTSATRSMKQGKAISLGITQWNNELGILNENFKEMAENLFSTQEKLQLKVAELQLANTKIQKAQSQLVQNAKMAGLGQLVAGVAHELNNPIGFLQSNIDYLEKTVKQVSELIDKEDMKELHAWKEKEDWPYLRDDLEKLLRACRDGAHRASQIVKDLQSFSRQDKGEKQEVYIEDLVENSLRLLRKQIPENVELVIKYSKDKKMVLCNANQINQVIMNLLTNAAHAVGEKGKILIETKQEEDGYHLIIEDDGEGIEEKDMKNIFDPFFTTKEVGKGTGLGLSISHSIVEEHGGKIQIDSKKGEGTRVDVILKSAR